MPKLTDKTELNTTPAANDLIHVVDVSDTTSSPQGTSKRNTVANFKADLVPYTGATSDVNLGSNNITANNLSGTNTGDQDLSGLVQKVAMADNAIVRANGASGDIQGSGATINDNGLLTASSLYSLTSGSNEAIVSASNVLGSAADAHATLQAYSSSGGDARVRLGVVSNYYTIGLDQTDSKLKFDLGQVVGGNTFMEVDQNGIIIKPLQPAFFARRTTNLSNITGTGNSVIVSFNSEIFDVGNVFSGSTTFNAPITSNRYYFNINLCLNDLTTSNFILVQLITTSYTYRLFDQQATPDGTQQIINLSISNVQMQAGDTAIVQLIVAGSGSNNIDVLGDATTTIRTYFSGGLL